MKTKEYKSELGKLYQSKRDEAPLRKIVFEVYSLFKFWIESGEMLPNLCHYLNMYKGLKMAD